ncbi:15068_t:CDS:10, partial [Entrophospora sp. SA101]
HLLSNPEIVRSMVMQNPAMRQMIERNPEIGHIINDPSFIRQTMDMARNPELMREMMRNNDRALANLETIPGGFNHLRRMYHTLQEPLESAGRNAANQRLAQILNVEKPPEGRINTTPLPNPWAPRNNNNLGSLGGITSSGNVTNPFGGIPSFSLMGFPPNQAPFQSLSTNTNNRLPNSNSQLNNGSSAPTNNTSSQPSSTNALRRSFQTTSTTPTTSTATSTPTSTTSSSPSTVATSTTSTTPQPINQSSEPPEARFREQLRNLKDMGFMDQAANIRALLAAGGDVNSASNKYLAIKYYGNYQFVHIDVIKW